MIQSSCEVIYECPKCSEVFPSKELHTAHLLCHASVPDSSACTIVFANDQTPTPSRDLETLQDLHGDKLLPINPFDLAFRSVLHGPTERTPLVSKDSMMTPVLSVSSSQRSQGSLARAETVEIEDDNPSDNPEQSSGKPSLLSLPSGFMSLMRMDSNKSYSDINDITISPIPLSHFTDSFVAANSQMQVSSTSGHNTGVTTPPIDHARQTSPVVFIASNYNPPQSPQYPLPTARPDGDAQFVLVQNANGGAYHLIRMEDLMSMSLSGPEPPTQGKQSPEASSTSRQSVMEALRRRCAAGGGRGTPRNGIISNNSSTPSEQPAQPAKRKHPSEENTNGSSLDEESSSKKARRPSSSHTSDSHTIEDGEYALMMGCEEKDGLIRERNRAAAQRCRQKKKLYVQKLEKRYRELELKYKKLEITNAETKEENNQLKKLLLEQRNRPLQILGSIMGENGEPIIIAAPGYSDSIMTHNGPIPGPSNG